MNCVVVGIALVAMLIISGLVISGILYIAEYSKTKKSWISFREGLDLAELPIATFVSKGKKLNFLLDTGSNNSIIDVNVLNSIDHEVTGDTFNTIGIGGSGSTSYGCKLTIGYKNQEFNEDFNALDLKEVFGTIKSETGVNIHGILGNKFFEKYKYVIDFKDFRAYKK